MGVNQGNRLDASEIMTCLDGVYAGARLGASEMMHNVMCSTCTKPCCFYRRLPNFSKTTFRPCVYEGRVKSRGCG